MEATEPTKRWATGGAGKSSAIMAFINSQVHLIVNEVYFSFTCSLLINGSITQKTSTVLVDQSPHSGTLYLQSVNRSRRRVLVTHSPRDESLFDLKDVVGFLVPHRWFSCCGW